MDFFSDPEFIKLSALGCAFIIGVGVCIYVALRETAELKRKRRAKQLMYQDEVQRELDRKKQLMARAQEQDSGNTSDNQSIDTQSPMRRSTPHMFA